MKKKEARVKWQLKVINFIWLFFSTTEISNDVFLYKQGILIPRFAARYWVVVLISENLNNKQDGTTRENLFVLMFMDYGFSENSRWIIKLSENISNHLPELIWKYIYSSIRTIILFSGSTIHIRNLIQLWKINAT